MPATDPTHLYPPPPHCRSHGKARKPEELGTKRVLMGGAEAGMERVLWVGRQEIVAFTSSSSAGKWTGWNGAFPAPKEEP